MKTKLILMLALCWISIQPLSAQKGTIRGTVIDKEYGDPLIGVNVVIDGTVIGASTDFDGNFSIEVEKGTYTLVLSYISYTTQKIENVVVQPYSVTTINATLVEDNAVLQEVVIEAKSLQFTEGAILTQQKKASGLLDGLSAQTFSKRGDGDVGAALNRVIGVTVKNGKEVFVRGIGDRYNQSVLNGMQIPGLNPTKNSVQLDLFPTSVVDNIIIYKTFSADLPANFTGGLVDITSKEFPDKFAASINVSLGFDPVSHFNKNAVTYQGGKTDFLAIDNGNRGLPFAASTVFPLEFQDNPQLTVLTNQFNKTLATKTQMRFLDESYAFSIGNQYNKTKGDIGYNIMVNYSNKNRFIEDRETSEYIINLNDDNLERLRFTRGDVGTNDVLWSAMGTLAYKNSKSKFKLNTLYIQNAVKEATQLVEVNSDGNNNSDEQKDALAYNQRSIINVQMMGQHHFDKMDMDWNNSFSSSTFKNLDERTTDLRGTLSADLETFSDPTFVTSARYFRFLEEMSNNAKLDFTIPFKLGQTDKSSVKFGIYESIAKQDFEILRYDLAARAIEVNSTNPDDLLLNEHIWTATENVGYYYQSGDNILNKYSAIANVAAVYGMVTLEPIKKFRIVAGLRVEKADILYTGNVRNSQTNQIVKFEKENILNELDFLPSVALKYEVIANMNLRASFTRTLARPSFREKAPIAIFDPIAETIFLGNDTLGQTNINNYDVRWEYFFGSGEMISVSGYYKQLQNPIEIAFSGNTRQLQPINVPEGKIAGVEVELKKSMDFVHKKISNLFIGANASYIYSEITMSPMEFTGKQNFAAEGVEVFNTRRMADQAPYVVNAFLDFSDSKIGLTANLSYNIQGEKIAFVGLGAIPNVYAKPFHSLNLRVAQQFGKNKQMQLSLAIKNLLNQNVELEYRAERFGSALYSNFNEPQTFTLGFTYGFKK
jgi:TonB-dependent receptor